MKGIGVFAAIAALAFGVFNYWQVTQLRNEVALLKVQIAEQRAGGVTDAVLARAALALAEARNAISGSKLEQARAALDTAKEYLGDARTTAGEKAAPRLKWLQEQAQGLSRQVQDRMGR